MRLANIEPTVFFVQGEEGLLQAVDLELADLEPGLAQVLVESGAVRATVDLPVSAGASQRIYIPDLREPTSVSLTLLVDDELHDRRVLDWQPERHWEVYLVPGSHHDLGYTDLPSHVLREQDVFLDRVLDYCQQTADWPADSRYRYVVEQGWSVLHFLEHRPAEAIRQLVHWLREGRIEVTALLGNETSELCGHEEQVRLLYPSWRLRRRYGVPIRTAELNDVPGLSWGLATILTGAGIRYFAPALPDYFSWGFQVRPFWDEEAVLPRDGTGAFWWEAATGDRLLFWYGHGIDLWTYDQALRALPERLGGVAAQGYPWDLIRFRVQGGHRDNSPPDLRFSLITREWNVRWAYPRLRVATNTDFFDELERLADGDLRVLRGELPNTDYTVGATSTARATAVNRRTHDALATAERLAAIASLVSDYPYPADTLAEAYDSSLLYDEHTWGMAHPIGPAQQACWSEKSAYAYRAAALADDVRSKSTNRLADQIRLSDEGYHLVVFNPLARARTDLVQVQAIEPSSCGRPMYWRHPTTDDAPPTWVLGTALGRDLVRLPDELLEQPLELVDLSSGESVSCQVVSLGAADDPEMDAPRHYALGVSSDLCHKDLLVNPAHHKALLFVARDVPSLGYKTYRLLPGTNKADRSSSLVAGDEVLENEYYKIVLDPDSGAVVSLYDKELEREWVDTHAAHGMNQLVVRSARTGEAVHPTNVRIVPGDKGPLRASLRIESAVRGCPTVVQEIALYEGLKRVTFSARLLKDVTPLLEYYLAFPYCLTAPRFEYEASNTVIRPISDQIPGSNTDAYAVQHWVDVWDREGGVAWASLDAPVVALGELWPSPVSQAHHAVTGPGFGREFLGHPSQFENGHIYSYALVNNFRTNFQPVQSGDLLFRHAMTTYVSPRERRRARAFGQAVAVPLLPVPVLGPQQGALPAEASFCALDQENVSLLTLKAAEDGEGLVVRLAETEGRDTVVRVELPFLEIDQAVRTNLVEEDQATVSYGRHHVCVALPANGLATVRCKSGRRWPAVSRFSWH